MIHSTETNGVPAMIRGGRLRDAVAFLQRETGTPEPSPEPGRPPVFLLSAGWRSGSTLLQRLIGSDRSLLMWGEPFGDCLPVCRLASMIETLGPESAHLRYSLDKFQGSLSDQWIANLNPGLRALRDAHLAFFESLFAQPAAAQGYQRWGAKWVRLSGYHAAYLKWLYPNSKIVFLVRHPLDSYRSYKGRSWYTEKPGFAVRGVGRFVRHWGYLANSFLAMREELDALLVRYEDLTSDPSTLDALEAFLDIAIDRSLLKAKVGAHQKNRVSRFERYVCRFVSRSTCHRLGYGS